MEPGVKYALTGGGRILRLPGNGFHANDLPDQSTTHAFGVPPEMQKIILQEAFRPEDLPVAVSDRRPKIYKPSLPVGILRLNSYFKVEAQKIMEEMNDFVTIFTNIPDEEFEEVLGPLRDGVRRAANTGHRKPFRSVDVPIISSRYPRPEAQDIQHVWLMPMLNLPALCRVIQHIALEEPESWPAHLQFKKGSWVKQGSGQLPESMLKQVLQSFESVIRTGVPELRLNGDFSHDFVKNCTRPEDSHLSNEAKSAV